MAGWLSSDRYMAKAGKLKDKSPNLKQGERIWLLPLGATGGLPEGIRCTEMRSTSDIFSGGRTALILEFNFWNLFDKR